MRDLPDGHATAMAADAASGGAGERNDLLDAMDRIPQLGRVPRENPQRSWTPMAPILNQARWNQVMSVLIQYANNGKRGEYRAEACRRVEKALTEPDSGGKLDLSNLGLREAPPILANVVELDLSGNRLTSLPPLPCTIKKLFLARNQLKTLPAELPQDLSVLHVAHNDLSALPDTLPPSLVSIHAQGNALQALPANMPRSLHIMDVCCNRGPNLVSAAAGMLIKLSKERTMFMPMRALIDQGHRRQAGKRCDRAMQTHLRHLLPDVAARGT
ncbi:MAG TPA: hypothetical protein VL522_04700 [Bordetella sp.]|nr:hypothetical protein [Bordetella sp.]